jgi:UDP-N-acetylmuramyl pentapeptide phosphotransferase/UDP-N-acetylglucosamine-1-phosphate transferase
LKDYNLLLAFITAFSVVLLATPSLIKVAKLKHLVDEPVGDRKRHTSSIPTIGGVIIFSAFIFSCFLWFPDDNAQVLKQIDEFMYLMASLILLFFVGVKDDIIGMSPMKKLLSHIMVGFILVVMGGIKITSFHGLLGIDILLPEYASILLSIFIYIVIVNSINLIDGVDGLASGVGLIATLTFGFWFSVTDQIHWALVSFSMSGALLGFLVFNFNPARIFMGDSGSLIIGAVISVLAIRLIETPIEFLPSQAQLISTPVMAMAILAYPLLDTLRVFFIRAINGKSPLSADRNHLHHKLQDKMYGDKRIVFTIYIFNTIMIVQAMFFQFKEPTISFLISLGFAFLFIAFVFIGYKKKVN